jgi:hypothetical protein
MTQQTSNMAEIVLVKQVVIFWLVLAESSWVEAPWIGWVVPLSCFLLAVVLIYNL